VGEVHDFGRERVNDDEPRLPEESMEAAGQAFRNLFGKESGEERTLRMALNLAAIEQTRQLRRWRKIEHVLRVLTNVMWFAFQVSIAITVSKWLWDWAF